MAYFTSGHVDNAITTATRIGLAGSAVTAGSPFAQFEAWARADVKSAALNAGYELSDTSDDANVQRLAIAAWYSYAAGARKGIEIPDRIKEDLFRLEQLREGKYRLPGLTPSARDAIGGVKFSATTGTNGRVAYFSRSALKNSW